MPHESVSATVVGAQTHQELAPAATQSKLLQDGDGRASPISTTDPDINLLTAFVTHERAKGQLSEQKQSCGVF